ncbi:MAG: hypothetical protein PHU25_05005 [Deltaproteobacteria bacterium]|nr:hypothetical protein [Deltaproteobacteria bacterium]
MRKILFLGAVAALAMGCAANTAGKVKDASAPEARIMPGGTGVAAAAAPAPVMHEYVAQTLSRPDKREMAVHNHWAKAKAAAQNNDYYKPAAGPTDTAQREAVQLAKKKLAQARSAPTDDMAVLVSTPGRISDKEKASLIRTMKAKRNALAMTADDSAGSGDQSHRVDLTMRDVRMPANRVGFVTPERTKSYYTRDDCRNGACYDKSKVPGHGLSRCNAAGGDFCR